MKGWQQLKLVPIIGLMKRVKKLAVCTVLGVLVSCAAAIERSEDLMNVTLKSNIYSNSQYAQTVQQFTCAVSLNVAVSEVRKQPTYGMCRAMLAKAYQMCADIYDRAGRQWVTDLTNGEVRSRGAEQFCRRWYWIQK